MAKKNLSPKELSAFTALVLSIPVSLGFFILHKNWITGLVSFVLIFLGSYFLILSIIQNFIYRKIKLIYKFINQTKASKKEEMYYKYILPKKSIDEVREDVEAWAEQRSKEVELLKENETFRKEFLQNLSHEFKTPVFAIQGYVDTLLQGAMENPETNKRFLEKTAKNTERLVTLLKDLDEISKLERGELKLHKQYFVIQDVIKEVFESLFWKAEQHNISFSFKKGCEQPLTVFAERDKIRQVVSNLVDNSIKYGRYGGNIVASAYNTDDKNILIEISDDGMGIHEKYIDRVFERFFRTAEGRGRDIMGSGLGLSICKHIIEAHGHNVHVRSKENVGTTIGFTLNAKKGA
jgi:two-component system, OmpR family, phosphate regulon sensor histidine kinase PhoR